MMYAYSNKEINVMEKYTLKDNLFHLFVLAAGIVITLLWLAIIFWVVKHTYPVLLAIACAFIVVESFKKRHNPY